MLLILTDLSDDIEAAFTAGYERKLAELRATPQHSNNRVAALTAKFEAGALTQSVTEDEKRRLAEAVYEDIRRRDAGVTPDWQPGVASSTVQPCAAPLCQLQVPVRFTADGQPSPEERVATCIPGQLTVPEVFDVASQVLTIEPSAKQQPQKANVGVLPEAMEVDLPTDQAIKDAVSGAMEVDASEHMGAAGPVAMEVQGELSDGPSHAETPSARTSWADGIGAGCLVPAEADDRATDEQGESVAENAGVPAAPPGVAPGAAEGNALTIEPPATQEALVEKAPKVFVPKMAAAPARATRPAIPMRQFLASVENLKLHST